MGKRFTTRAQKQFNLSTLGLSCTLYICSCLRVYSDFRLAMADLKGLDGQEEEIPTIAEDVVVTKYKMAGDMANSKHFVATEDIFLVYEFDTFSRYIEECIVVSSNLLTMVQ